VIDRHEFHAAMQQPTDTLLGGSEAQQWADLIAMHQPGDKLSDTNDVQQQWEWNELQSSGWRVEPQMTTSSSESPMMSFVQQQQHELLAIVQAKLDKQAKGEAMRHLDRLSQELERQDNQLVEEAASQAVIRQRHTRAASRRPSQDAGVAEYVPFVLDRPATWSARQHVVPHTSDPTLADSVHVHELESSIDELRQYRSIIADNLLSTKRPAGARQDD
jgi:hypothetical protein